MQGSSSAGQPPASQDGGVTTRHPTADKRQQMHSRLVQSGVVYSPSRAFVPRCRRDLVLAAETSEEVSELLQDLGQLRVVPLLQALLFDA